MNRREIEGLAREIQAEVEDKSMLSIGESPILNSNTINHTSEGLYDKEIKALRDDLKLVKRKHSAEKEKMNQHIGQLEDELDLSRRELHAKEKELTTVKRQKLDMRKKLQSV